MRGLRLGVCAGPDWDDVELGLVVALSVLRVVGRVGADLDCLGRPGRACDDDDVDGGDDVVGDGVVGDGDDRDVDGFGLVLALSHDDDDDDDDDGGDDEDDVEFGWGLASSVLVGRGWADDGGWLVGMEAFVEDGI